MTRMFKIALLIGCALGMAACKQQEAPKQNAKPDATKGAAIAPYIVPTMQREIVPMNPASGESQRINQRDDLSRLREVQISFSNQSRGYIWKNEVGYNTRAKMVLPDGTIFEGTIPEGGSVPTPIKATAQGGRPVAELVSGGTAGHSLKVFDKEGKLRFTEKRDGEHKVQTLYTADKPVFEMEFDKGVRLSLRIFSNGVRIYEEVGGEQFDVQRRYIGTVYSLDGKATHRVTLFEGIYSEGAGNPTTIEFLAEDGKTVVGEVDLSKQKVDDYFAGRQHTGPKLGYWETTTELTHGKRILWESVQESRRIALRMEADITQLFNDRSK